MHPTVKSQIINLEDWADVALALMRQHLYDALPDSPTDTIDEAWTYAVARKWVGKYLNDEFNTQMKWAKSTSDAEDYALGQLTLGIGESDPKVSIRKLESWLKDQIYQALDPVIILIGELVHSIVSANPWWIWLPHINHGIAVMESVEDYRIQVFHEKVSGGEWSH